MDKEQEIWSDSPLILIAHHDALVIGERQRLLKIVEDFREELEERLRESKRNQKGLSGMSHAFEIGAIEELIERLNQ